MTTAPNKAELLSVLIARRAIRALFQPIVDLNDGMVIAYEALCRPLPDMGFAHADDLFHSADEAGMLWELEVVTREVAMAAAADWPRDVRLFLNTSPSVFADERFARVLTEDLLRIPGVTTDQIVLEITERSESRYDDRLLRQVTLAKEGGFNVAIDDAGAGTSGLNRMMRIRPHWIKLDRQLVAGIDQDALKQNLVRSFVHFARMSGVSVIAEGIEKPAELGTLMGLGIRFGQGYYLGRPAERAATMDTAAISKVRELWAAVDAMVPSEPSLLPMVRLCVGVPVIDSGLMPIRDAAALLVKNSEHSGVVVTEGRRLVGWVDRGTMLDAAVTAGPTDPISAIVKAAVCALTPDATVQEALQFASTREDADLAEPLIIAAGPEIVGVVSMRELLRAAAADARPSSGQKGATMGMPARVRADQHLEQMILRGQDAAMRNAKDYHADGAFIDVRRFADYNGVFGYEMGDRLIQSLSKQINDCVVRNSDGVFLAHLGDDRFMVTARAGVLEPRLRLLMQTFEQMSPMLTDPALVAGRHEASPGLVINRDGPRLGLRVLLLPCVFDRVTHPREIYRVEQQLRQKARNQEGSMAPGQSLLVVDQRGGVARAERLAA